MQSKDNENGVRSPRVDLSATKAHEAPTVMISNDKASDQTKLSMECQVKDDDYKICKICGDKALGYNFNVISCESCKAFFRRNAMKSKDLRCPFSDNCVITVSSRRFCQRCRLNKCFELGMKKEWIMSEEALFERRQRNEGKKLATGMFHIPFPNGHYAVKRQCPFVIMDEPVKRYRSEPEMPISFNPAAYYQFGGNYASHFNFGDGSWPTAFSNWNAVAPAPNARMEMIMNNSYVPRQNCQHLFGVQPPTRSSSDPNISPIPPFVAVRLPIKSYLETVEQQNPLHQQAKQSQERQTVPPDVLVVSESSAFSPAKLRRPHSLTLPLEPFRQEKENDRVYAAKPTAIDQFQIASEQCDQLMLDQFFLESFHQLAREKSLKIDACDGAIEQDVEKEMDKNLWLLSSLNNNSSGRMDRLKWMRMEELLAANRIMGEPMDFRAQTIGRDTLCPNGLDVAMMANIGVRRLIRMCKRISSFRNLCQADQITLLRGGCKELLALRGIMAYNSKNDSFDVCSYPTPRGQVKLTELMNGKNSCYYKHKIYLESFDEIWRRDECVMMTLMALTLFYPYRRDIINKDAVWKEYKFYLDLLNSYLIECYEKDQALKHYLALSERMDTLKRRINDCVATIFLDINLNNLEPLLVEALDLQEKPNTKKM